MTLHVQIPSVTNSCCVPYLPLFVGTEKPCCKYIRMNDTVSWDNDRTGGFFTLATMIGERMEQRLVDIDEGASRIGYAATRDGVVLTQ